MTVKKTILGLVGSMVKLSLLVGATLIVVGIWSVIGLGLVSPLLIIGAALWGYHSFVWLGGIR